MKKFWKALGIAALAAAVPVRFKRDEETGKKTYQSLLLSVDVNTSESGKAADIGINLGDGLLNSAVMSVVKKKETVHFADDEPEAAVVPGVALAGEQAEPAASADEEAGEEDFDPEV